jgi:hypothetical protein
LSCSRSLKVLLRNNGLSLILTSLFVVFFGGQVFSGWLNYNQERTEHHRPQVALNGYLRSGSFGEAVFENWESEFLQMGLYVVLTAFLFQRGSAESKDPDREETVGSESATPRDSDIPLPVKKGGLILALYRHSLSLAFAVLFTVSFVGHAIFGARAYNEEALQHGEQTLSSWQYLGTSQFWFESFQNWQSEFLAILAIVVFSIWLREDGSPESKPLAAPHARTGA